MSHSDRTISERDLLAYVDGALDTKARALVAAHLAESPADAETIAHWRFQNETLHELYDRFAEEAVPERLGIYRIAADRRSRLGDWRYMAAAVLLLAIGGIGGWSAGSVLGISPDMPRSLVDEAVAAHALYASEVVHPVEVKGSDEAHLAKWLSNRLDRIINIPDLRSAGFGLVGGRLLPAGHQPAAQFMYEDASGRRVTLYVIPRQDGRETSLQYASSDHVEAVFWSDETIDCALVGELSRSKLHQLAVAAYQQLL